MTETVDDPAFWAVVQHHRAWWAADGPCRWKVAQEGQLLVDVASVIARDYGVARTIGGLEVEGSDPIPGLPRLVEAINKSAWPNGLQHRAAVCVGLANGHRDWCNGKAPISAVTKLMWFLRPDGWTMFDTYARHGLIGHDNDTTAFYDAMHKARFDNQSRCLKSLCNDHGFAELWGERIIDKFLMLHGARLKDGEGEGSFYARARWMNTAYLDLMPPEPRGRLAALAMAVHGRLRGSASPFRVWAPRGRNLQRQTGGERA